VEEIEDLVKPKVESQKKVLERAAAYKKQLMKATKAEEDEMKKSKEEGKVRVGYNQYE
jgi:hypothetical protein